MSRARSAGAVLLLVAAALCLGPPAAHAENVSSQELRRLALAASTDPAALAELREVDSVDGRPMNVAAALRGARGDDLDARLRALSAPVASPAPAGDPRAQAREVLSEKRFQRTTTGPFRDLLERLGRALPGVNLGWLDDLLPGGRNTVWLLLAVVVGLPAWLLSRRVLGRRIRAAVETAGAAAGERDDPRALDRRAAAAESAGDLEAALRLRFRAGLLRLDARGAIVFRPSISTYEVRRALHSDDFDALAATFDDVVYGGRPPSEADVAAARDRWPAVINR